MLLYLLGSPVLQQYSLDISGGNELNLDLLHNGAQDEFFLV